MKFEIIIIVLKKSNEKLKAIFLKFFKFYI